MEVVKVERGLYRMKLYGQWMGAQESASDRELNATLAGLFTNDGALLQCVLPMPMPIWYALCRRVRPLYAGAVVRASHKVARVPVLPACLP